MILNPRDGFLSRLASVFSLFLLFTSLEAESPRVLDAEWTIQQIAAEPELVTPTGCCFDDQGRLMVIECHTHFPPDDYKGPKTDRIYRFDDSDGDGVVDRKSLFYEGGIATMNIVNLGDGSFAVATRSEVVKLHDSDDDGVADQRDVLLRHDTRAVYPHNGLGGLTLGSDGWLYVGQGENFGEPYDLIGTDGSKQVGGGEGGNVFRCQPDGSRLERVATGFWNPFGMVMDNSNRLFAVGNDPDAMPPNRLMQVVRGGDFGFQFRFGRAGIHPLQCWNGELPGTLPMIAGTGEAVCAVAVVGDRLWATSWGDNRVERYSLEPRGASWESKTEVVVQGDANFRPVGMAVAPDGSILITDWVDRSYSVHGKGRLWRMSRKTDAEKETASMPALTDSERNALRLSQDSNVTTAERLQALENDDPFVRQAATTGLIESGQLPSIENLLSESAPRQVGLLSAWRWRELCDPSVLPIADRERLLHVGLNSPSGDVLLTALRWATERGCKEELPTIRSLLERDDLTPRVFSAILASIAYLETGSASGKSRDPAIEKSLYDFAADPNRPMRLRALALQKIPADAHPPSDVELGRWSISGHDREFALEAVRCLIERSSPSANRQLVDIATNDSIDEQTRSDALTGLSHHSHGDENWIKRLAEQTKYPLLRREASRESQTVPESARNKLPSRDDLDAWEILVAGEGDVDAGRRVFLRRACAACHAHSGRGAKTGPDLTTLSGKMTRRRILESILQPSKEVGPLYVPWIVLTSGGTAITGLKLDAPGVGNSVRFQGADGKITEVALEDIELQKPTESSIMPDGLQETMSPDELRDLLTFLTTP